MLKAAQLRGPGSVHCTYLQASLFAVYFRFPFARISRPTRKRLSDRRCRLSADHRILIDPTESLPVAFPSIISQQFADAENGNDAAGEWRTAFASRRYSPE